MRPCLDPWIRKIPWRRKWLPTPVLYILYKHLSKNKKKVSGLLFTWIKYEITFLLNLQRRTFLEYLVLQCVSCTAVSNSATCMDCSPPDSSVHGILQVKILEQVVISFSRGSSWPRDWILHCRQQFLYHLSHQGSPFNV